MPYFSFKNTLKCSFGRIHTLGVKTPVAWTCPALLLAGWAPLSVPAGPPGSWQRTLVPSRLEESLACWVASPQARGYGTAEAGVEGDCQADTHHCP